MAHTLIASKAVERMFHSDDEAQGLKASIEKDFMGLPSLVYFLAEITGLILSFTRLKNCPGVDYVCCCRNHGN